MSKLPLRGNRYHYGGQNPAKRRQTVEKNQLVDKIVKYANAKIANNPEEIQQLFFSGIALDLQCDVEIVHHALSDGGHNGITIRVTAEDRNRLEHFKNLV